MPISIIEGQRKAQKLTAQEGQNKENRMTKRKTIDRDVIIYEDKLIYPDKESKKIKSKVTKIIEDEGVDHYFFKTKKAGLEFFKKCITNSKE